MEDFLESYRAAREAGFENINIDLMSALPGQTVSSWEKTLRTRRFPSAGTYFRLQPDYRGGNAVLPDVW